MIVTFFKLSTMQHYMYPSVATLLMVSATNCSHICLLHGTCSIGVILNTPQSYPFWAAAVFGPIVYICAVVHAALWRQTSSILGSIVSFNRCITCDTEWQVYNMVLTHPKMQVKMLSYQCNRCPRGSDILPDPRNKGILDVMTVEAKVKRARSRYESNPRHILLAVHRGL